MKSVTGENVLLKRFLFTVMVLAIFRLGVHIPMPGVNTKALLELTSQQGGLLSMMNMFSGGALSQFSILALGIFPYISASIIMQLSAMMIPSLEQMQKEGATGRLQIQRITRVLALVLALVQGYGAASALTSLSVEEGAAPLVYASALGYFEIVSALLIAAGTCFVMWLGEQIGEKGIGNGASMIIFAGIVAFFPKNVVAIVNDFQQGETFTGLGVIVFALLMVFGVTYIEQSYRKIPIEYARRAVGRGQASVQSSHLPMKVNMANVMPAIFASTILGLPLTFQAFSPSMQGSLFLNWLYPNHWLYNIAFAFLVIFFCYLYTGMIFKPDEVAENLKRQNAFVPGFRPGTETSGALSMVVTRLILAGALYMNIICLLPGLLISDMGKFSLGGTSLLIVVGVGLETIRQVSAHLATQKYDSLMFFGDRGEGVENESSKDSSNSKYAF